MTDMDKRIRRQMRWLSIAVFVLIILIISNFYIAFARPNETTQTIVGPIGPQGLSIKGDKGDKGDQGEIGPRGAAGQEGPAGQNGSNGSNGVNGLPGADGRDGQNGADGINGTNGVNGKTPILRCNTDNHAIEWMYDSDSTWQPLLYFDPANANCTDTYTNPTIGE